MFEKVNWTSFRSILDWMIRINSYGATVHEEWMKYLHQLHLINVHPKTQMWVSLKYSALANRRELSQGARRPFSSHFF